MRTSWDYTECQNLKNALSKEWLETNGLGGYASSTIVGANTRRHHGLLVAALKPPGARHVLLSKLEERVQLNGQECWLSTNLYPGTVFPHGFNIQNEFCLCPWPMFRYVGAGFEIEKSVCLIHGEHTVVVAYRLRHCATSATLGVRPLLAFRDFNQLTRQRSDLDLSVQRRDSVFSVQPRRDLPRLFLHVSPCEIEGKPDWYFRLTYPVDRECGFEHEEDLFSPLELKFRLVEGETVYVVATLEPCETLNAVELMERERQRRGQFRDRDAVWGALRAAADAFVVRRGEQGLSIVAGYPWHGESGRSAMISLPGLLLCTRRFEEARRVLATFAQYCHRGLIPNLLSAGAEKPAYNSVDASLWFVVAAWRYWRASRNKKAMLELLPTLREIVRWYQAGTDFDIRADEDDLITAGTPGSQLTWMDVKLEGYVPTPRHGKAVEINALWFNALLMMADLEETITRDEQAAERLRAQAGRVAAHFVKTFWYPEGGYLFDVVQGAFRDASVRPNQIFAVSLPFSPLSAEQQASVLTVVTEQLLTPYGLRTLSPKHEKYAPRYRGTRWQRDAIRHQGAVWPFLIGAYADAFLRVHGHEPESRWRLREQLRPLLEQLEQTGLGSVSELFDAEPPHYPAGCPAHACSVAELLRAYELCRK